MRIQNGEKVAGLAYIGLGDHMRASHTEFIGALTTCEVIGVADVSRQRLEEGEQVPGLVPDPTITEDYHKLLDDPRVDGVLIGTGDKYHLPIARDVIRAGKSVLSEKPAAVGGQLWELPKLLQEADRKDLRFWVCHPREFGEGPWAEAMQLIGNPALISQHFDVGAMGDLLELTHSCLYTLPEGKSANLHGSFADDKLNHTIVSIMRALPSIVGFSNATLFHNTDTQFEARLEAKIAAQRRPVVIHAAGRRSAHTVYHGGKGVYNDWIEAIFEEGILRVHPSLGKIELIYGSTPKEPLTFDKGTLYDNMFESINKEFVEALRDPTIPNPLPSRVITLGTAAAILMQRPGFSGEISEAAVVRLGTRRARLADHLRELATRY